MTFIYGCLFLKTAAAVSANDLLACIVSILTMIGYLIIFDKEVGYAAIEYE
jgi:hypothetical protein